MSDSSKWIDPLVFAQVVNKARRVLIYRMENRFSRASTADITEMVDWMIDNRWISAQFYDEIEALGLNEVTDLRTEEDREDEL